MRPEEESVHFIDYHSLQEGKKSNSVKYNSAAKVMIRYMTIRSLGLRTTKIILTSNMNIKLNK